MVVTGVKDYHASQGKYPVHSRWWQEPAGIFLMLGLISGFTLLLLLPPHQVADEWRHFYRVYQLAEGRLTGHGLGDDIPRALTRLTYETEGFFGIPTREAKPWREGLEFLRNMTDIRIDSKDSGYVSFPSVLYAPVPYTGMVAAVALGRWWTDSPLLLMYMGRLGGLLLALGMVWYAIRLTPFGKWFFLLIAMTPVVAYQRAGMSPDGFITALAMLQVALVLAAAFSPAGMIGGGGTFRLGIITVALCLCKQTYLALPLLNWLIPADRFTRPGYRWLLHFWTPVLGWVAAIGWAMLVMDRNYEPMMAGADALAQLKWILAHPLGYANVLIRDLFVHIYQYVHELIGTLGWLDVPAANGLVLAHAVVLIGVGIVDGDHRTRLTRFIRGWTALVLLASLVLVCTLMYLWWAPVGSPDLPGMQGRYFAPFLPLLLILFSWPLSMQFAAPSFFLHMDRLTSSRLWPTLIGCYAFGLAAETIWRVIHHHYR